jgi:hypothetical protein
VYMCMCVCVCVYREKEWEQLTTEDCVGISQIDNVISVCVCMRVFAPMDSMNNAKLFVSFFLFVVSFGEVGFLFYIVKTTLFSVACLFPVCS